jgi:hypothetical protein
VIDKTYGHASYGCATCCGYSTPTLLPDPFVGPPDINNTDVMQSIEQCGGEEVDLAGDAYDWSSTNTTVATLPTKVLHTVAIGSATGSGTVYVQGTHPAPQCPMVYFGPVQPIAVANPNHIVVEDDVQQTLSCSGNPDERQITYEIVDASDQQVIAPVAVREQFQNLSANTCGNGIGTTQTCTTVSGGFTDHISTGCVAPGHSVPCGFTATQQQWQWCNPNGTTPSIGTPGAETVTTSIITLGGNSTGFQPGYSPPIN